MTDKNFVERFEFRNIKPEEADQAVLIEQICFPPNEACTEQNMMNRIATAPELFLVAVDKETGKLAGFLNGLSTEEDVFRDEFFTEANLYDHVTGTGCSAGISRARSGNGNRLPVYEAGTGKWQKACAVNLSGGKSGNV